MRVLLVNPPSKSRRLYVSPPLGLMYLSSSLKAKNHEVEIADLLSFGGSLPKLSRFDVVGITGMSFQHTSMLSVAAEANRADKLVIGGGPHVSALPNYVSSFGLFDVCIVGEAESIIHEAILTERKVPNGIVLDGSAAMNDYLGFEYGLDFLPYPDWSGIDLNRYSDAAHGFFFERKPIAPIITSRGCPYACTFCASHCVVGKKWRPHSPDRVLKEIGFLVNMVGAKEIHIEDDNFTLGLNRAKEIMKRIVAEHFDIKIAFPNGVRIEMLDDNLLDLMKEAGVYCLSFGIESGSERIQKLARKNLDLKFVKQQVQKVKRHGFYTQAFFILGFPYETEEDVKQTVKYAKSLKLESAFFGAYIPLPGSEDFEKLNLKLDEIDWDNLYASKPFPSESLSSDDIARLLKQAYRKFYLRPATMWRNVRRLKSFSQMRVLVNRFKEMEVEQE